MTKKLFLLWVLLFVALVSYGTKREEQIFKVNGLYLKYKDTNFNSLRLIPAPKDSTQYTGEIVIPGTVEYVDTLVAESVGTRQVMSNDLVSIDAGAFKGTTITSVSIPEQLNSIGNNAFEECSHLNKAIFTSVNALCQTTFANIYANPLYYAHHLYVAGQELEVKSIEVPSGVTQISTAAFAGGSEIVSVTIPASVVSIGNDAFLGCSKLYSVDYPSIAALTSMVYGNNDSNPISKAAMIRVNPDCSCPPLASLKKS